MASLDLKLEGFTEDPTPQNVSSPPIFSVLKSKFIPKTRAQKADSYPASLPGSVFVILKDFLQPESTLSLGSITRPLADLLPENGTYSGESWALGEVCCELAEQIPYHHPSQLKLARLVERLGKSTKITAKLTTKDEPEVSYSWQRLGELLRDWFDEEENPTAWVNYSAFVANLYEYRVFGTTPTYAIRTLRDGLESKQEKGSIRDANILAAAQWILWYGQSLFKQVLYPADFTSEEMQIWASGELYTGKPLLSLQRWHFWRDGFKAVASEDGGSDECKNVFGGVVELMDSIEKNLLF